MKNILFAMLASFTFANASYAQNIDVNKVNSVIKNIIDPIVGQDTFFEDLSFVFKPETDITKNYVGFELSASTKQASWTTQLSSVNLTGTVGISDATATTKNLKANLQLALNTELVSFANYVNTVIAATTPCEMNDYTNPGSASSFFQNSFCNNITKALQASDYATLKTELAQVFNRAETEMKDFIAYAEANNLDPQLIKDAYANLKDIQSVKVVETADQVVISVSLFDFIDSSYLEENASNKLDLEFSVTPQFASVGLNVDITGEFDTISDIADYTKAQLQGLEQEDPQIKSYISSFAESYLELAKQFLSFQF